jgi:hypothetical protein
MPNEFVTFLKYDWKLWVPFAGVILALSAWVWGQPDAVSFLR